MFTSKPGHHYTITSITNGVNRKTGIPPQVETANISCFQFLGIVNLEHVLPNVLDYLKTYIH